MKQDWHTVQKDEPPVNRSLIIRPRINKQRCKLELECIGGRTLSYAFNSEEEAQKAYDSFLGVAEDDSAKPAATPTPKRKAYCDAHHGVAIQYEIVDGEEKAFCPLCAKILTDAKQKAKKKHPLAKCKGCGKRNHKCEC